MFKLTLKEERWEDKEKQEKKYKEKKTKSKSNLRKIKEIEPGVWEKKKKWKQWSPFYGHPFKAESFIYSEAKKLIFFVERVSNLAQLRAM